VSQRKTVFAQILSNTPTPEEPERPMIDAPVAASVPPERGNTLRKKSKLNKAVDPDYMKLTAYIPRDLHFEIKTAMAADHETDQSAYIERWLRQSLERHRSAKVPQEHGSLES
jgi:hypothetical protein